MRLALAALVLVGAGFVGGCGGDDGGGGEAEGPPAGATVTLENIEFNPETVRIKPGETVRWVWDDGSIEHDVAGEGFKSEIQTDGRFEHRFETAGTFPYVCTVHPDTMKATVEVS